jgi:hypothetical protein
LLRDLVFHDACAVQDLVTAIDDSARRSPYLLEAGDLLADGFGRSIVIEAPLAAVIPRRRPT